MSNMLTSKEVEQARRDLFSSDLEKFAGIKTTANSGDTSINKAIGDFQLFHERGFYQGMSLAMKAVAEGRVNVEDLKEELAQQIQKMKDEAKG